MILLEESEREIVPVGNRFCCGQSHFKRERNVCMKIKLYAGILSLLLAGGVLDAAEENLLINPGFEGPLLHGGRPEGFSWSKSSSLENASGRNATKCARLTAVEAHKAFRASLTTVLRKIPAGTYRLNGYVRGESFSFAYVLISGKGWKSRLWKLQKSVFIPEKDAWRRFTLEIPIPEEREQLMLTIEFHFPKAGESVLLDDLSLIRTEKEALPAPEQKKRAPASERKLIQNGSLVAHPAASVKVEWKRPVIAGRERRFFKHFLPFRQSHSERPPLSSRDSGYFFSFP